MRKKSKNNHVKNLMLPILTQLLKVDFKYDFYTIKICENSDFLRRLGGLSLIDIFCHMYCIIY